MFELELEKLAALGPLLLRACNPRLDARAAFLKSRLLNPEAYIILLGETSSGKSSLLNGIFAEAILPVGAAPTTGIITEVELAKNGRRQFLALDKEGLAREIDHTEFRSISLKPQKELLRLKYIHPFSSSGRDLGSLRFFDTPGYGSIIEEHEEVLKEFLPNADVVVYVINYKIGFQEEDRVFLDIALNLVREDVPFVLVVNRVPEGVTAGSVRIREIIHYVGDMLHSDPPVFLIPNSKPAKRGQSPLPCSIDLLAGIENLVSDSRRQRAMEAAFETYLLDLYEECMAVLERRYSESKMTQEELDRMRIAEQEYAKKITEAVPLLVLPCFDRLIRQVPQWLHKAAERVEKALNGVIDTSDKLNKKESLAYINNHLFPFTLQQETGEIQKRIESAIEVLNDKVDDYIQKETTQFNTTAGIILASNTSIAAQDVVREMGVRIALKGLERYLAAYGGAGGANAGVANAASHLLKRIGNFFGKTFSRKAHGSLKHFLAKIGATSARRAGLAIAVFIEAILLLIDLNSWQGKAKGKVCEALTKWERDTEPLIIDDLEKLRDVNIETLQQIAQEVLEDSPEQFDPQELERAKLDVEYGREVGSKLFGIDRSGEPI